MRENGLVKGFRNLANEVFKIENSLTKLGRITILNYEIQYNLFKRNLNFALLPVYNDFFLRLVDILFITLVNLRLYKIANNLIFFRSKILSAELIIRTY